MRPNWKGITHETAYFFRVCPAVALRFLGCLHAGRIRPIGAEYRGGLEFRSRPFRVLCVWSYRLVYPIHCIGNWHVGLEQEENIIGAFQGGDRRADDILRPHAPRSSTDHPACGKPRKISARTRQSSRVSGNLKSGLWIFLCWGCIGSFQNPAIKEHHFAGTASSDGLIDHLHFVTTG